MMTEMVNNNGEETKRIMVGVCFPLYSSLDLSHLFSVVMIAFQKQELQEQLLALQSSLVSLSRELSSSPLTLFSYQLAESQLKEERLRQEIDQLRQERQERLEAEERMRQEIEDQLRQERQEAEERFRVMQSHFQEIVSSKDREISEMKESLREQVTFGCTLDSLSSARLTLDRKP